MCKLSANIGFECGIRTEDVLEKGWGRNMLHDPTGDFERRLDQLSGIQRRIYDYIVYFINENQIAPTNRDINCALKMSLGLVSYHLDRIQDAGLINRDPKKSQSITLTKPRGMPVKGTIAAGLPLHIFEKPIQWIDLGRELEHDDIFALKVSGDSMIEDYICNGDFVVIRNQANYHDGDIVVAVHFQQGESSATLKGFHREKDGIRLQPANKDWEYFFIQKTEWEREWKIQGKVVAILRPEPISRYRLPEMKK